MDIKMKDCSLRPNITSSRLTINAAFTIAHQDFALRGTSHISTTFRNATMLGPELIQVRLIKSGKFCLVCWIHISGTSTCHVYFNLKHNFFPTFTSIQLREYDKLRSFGQQFLYLEGLRGFTQLFDDCRQSLWVDALLTQSYTYRQRLHVQASVQQPGDLQQNCGRKNMTGFPDQTHFIETGRQY